MKITFPVKTSDGTRRVQFHRNLIDGYWNTHPGEERGHHEDDADLIALDAAIKALGFWFMVVDDDTIIFFSPVEGVEDLDVFEIERLPGLVTAIAAYLGVAETELEVEYEITDTERAAQVFAALIARLSEAGEWNADRRRLTVHTDEQARRVVDILTSAQWQRSDRATWSPGEAAFDFVLPTLGTQADPRLSVVRTMPQWQIEFRPTFDGDWYTVGERFASFHEAQGSQLYTDLRGFEKHARRVVPVLV